MQTRQRSRCWQQKSFQKDPQIDRGRKVENTNFIFCDLESPHGNPLNIDGECSCHFVHNTMTSSDRRDTDMDNATRTLFAGLVVTTDVVTTAGTVVCGTLADVSKGETVIVAAA